MEKEFCTYNQSLAIKELGFDENCISLYHIQRDGSGEFEFCCEWDGDSYHDWSYSNVRLSAPLIQQAFRFFREKYGLYYAIVKSKESTWDYSIYTDDNNICVKYGENTYEEAEQSCLLKLLELAKKNINKNTQIADCIGFEIDNKTSSATKCKNCGLEKYLHL